MPVALDLCWFGCTSNPSFNISAAGKCWYPSPAFNKADNRTWWAHEGARLVNEPESGGETHLPGEPAGPRWTFVKWAVSYVQSITSTPTTVGVASVGSLATIGAAVDILSFHSYHNSWEAGLASTQTALAFATRFEKPVFNSETGCIARANAFDQTVEMAVTNGIGFVLWELMISDCSDCIDTRRWKHGLMFADGTTRDPAAVAAIRGVYLNRGETVGLAVARPNVEGAADRISSEILAWLAQNETASFTAGVQMLDAAANVLESSQVAPDAVPVSGLARVLGDQGDTATGRKTLAGALNAARNPLVATKNGQENMPGACDFNGTADSTPPCTRARGCILKRNDDLAFFSYTPTSTTVPQSCWTEVWQCPIPETNGTLHYCREKASTVQFALGGGGGGAVQLIGKVKRVDIIYKAGPDCGIFTVSAKGRATQTVDSYASAVNWEAATPIAADLDLAESTTFTVSVTGAGNPSATNAWVQVVGVHVWL